MSFNEDPLIDKRRERVLDHYRKISPFTIAYPNEGSGIDFVVHYDIESRLILRFPFWTDDSFLV
jgi:hypothetical protein